MSKHQDEPDMPEAARQVEKLTDSESVNGEDLLESEDLKRKLREAKARLSEPIAPPPA